MPGNSEVARAAYDAFNRGDIDDVLTVFSPDIEFNASDVFFDQRRTYRGPDEWRDEFVPAVFEVFTTYRADPEEVIDLGDACGITRQPRDFLEPGLVGHRSGRGRIHGRRSLLRIGQRGQA